MSPSGPLVKHSEYVPPNLRITTVIKQKLEYNPEIGKVVREMAPSFAVKDIFEAIQKHQFAPGSLTTFYKYYREDLNAGKIPVIQAVADKIIDQALNGEPDAPNTWKARELFIRSRGGWSPKETVEQRELDSEEAEESSAVATLANRLGIKISDD